MNGLDKNILTCIYHYLTPQDLYTTMLIDTKSNLVSKKNCLWFKHLKRVLHIFPSLCTYFNDDIPIYQSFNTLKNINFTHITNFGLLNLLYIQQVPINLRNSISLSVQYSNLTRKIETLSVSIDRTNIVDEFNWLNSDVKYDVLKFYYEILLSNRKIVIDPNWEYLEFNYGIGIIYKKRKRK